MKCVQKRTIEEVIEGECQIIKGVNINGQTYLLRIFNQDKNKNNLIVFEPDKNQESSALSEMQCVQKGAIEKLIKGNDLRFEGLEINEQQYSLNVMNTDGMLALAFNLDKNKSFGSVPEYTIGIDYKGIRFSRYVSRPTHDHADVEELQMVVNPNTHQTKYQKKGDLVWRSMHYSKNGYDFFYVPFEKTEQDEQKGVGSVIQFLIFIEGDGIRFLRYVDKVNAELSGSDLEEFKILNTQIETQNKDNIAWQKPYGEEGNMPYFYVPFGKTTE